MRLIEQQPVGPSRPRPELQDRREQLPEKHGAILEPHPEEIDGHALSGRLQQLDHLPHGRGRVPRRLSPWRPNLLEVSLGIKNAELVVKIAELLENPVASVDFPAA